jgi:hypothetical protein
MTAFDHEAIWSARYRDAGDDCLFTKYRSISLARPDCAQVLEVDDGRKDGYGQNQHQPFQVAPGQEAREMQYQDENGDDIEQRKQHLNFP